jgi:hypothetical protein
LPVNATCNYARETSTRLITCSAGLQCLDAEVTYLNATTTASEILSDVVNQNPPIRWVADQILGTPLGYTWPALARRDTAQYQCILKSSNKWMYGVAISVFGSIILNVGLNLQKFAFRKNELLLHHLKQPAFKLPVRCRFRSVF